MANFDDWEKEQIQFMKDIHGVPRPMPTVNRVIPEEDFLLLKKQIKELLLYVIDAKPNMITKNEMIKKLSDIIL